MKTIRDLDFSSMETIIRWIDKHATDEVAEIGMSGKEAVAVFESRGYRRDFVPPNKDDNDSDEFGRWIISQALENLDRHLSIHGLLRKFTSMWIERFAATK